MDENAVLARIQYDDLEAQAAAAAEQVKVAEAQAAEAEAAIAAARLEIPRLEAALEEAGSQVAEATVTRARLGRDVERSRPLFERGVVDAGHPGPGGVRRPGRMEGLAAAEARARGATAARVAWDGRIRQLEAALVVVRAGVALARRSEEVAGILVEKTRIRAPFPGLVVRKDAELGEVIAPTGAGNSRGSVFTIVDPASLEVQVELSEKRILKVAEGDAATVFLDADPEKGLPAKVRKIWPRADRSKGTIEIRVTFDARPEGLRPEMAARVVFRGKASAEVAGAPVRGGAAVGGRPPRRGGRGVRAWTGTWRGCGR